MKTFYTYWLHWACGVAKKDLNLERNFRNELSNAIALDDRKKLLAFASAWPELFVKMEDGITHYSPIAQMGLACSIQTLREIVKIYPAILDAKSLYGGTIAHYAAQQGRVDILDALAEIKPSVLLVKNNAGKTPLDELLPALEDRVIDLQKKIPASEIRPL